MVTAEGGFNPTWQRHVAAYALSEPRLRTGRVVDVGCGIGHSYHLLSARETVGVDQNAAALDGQDRETVVADMRDMPFADGDSMGAGCALDRHVRTPERALARSRECWLRKGSAVLVTPNRLTFARADEIIDPYHYVEYDPDELRALCETVFGSVEMAGIFGSDRYRAIVAREHARLDALLALDPLRLRRLVPRSARQRLYDWRLSRERIGKGADVLEITPDDFTLGHIAIEAAYDLVAVCRVPKRDR